jgi:nucleoside-diphosphate-sugar epimerase
MQIIITGATGFIGRRLIKTLTKCAPNAKILCLIYKNHNSLEDSGRQVLSAADVSVKEIDLVTGFGLNNLPSRVDLVIHLAASTESSDSDHRCNDVGSQNLMKALKGINKQTHFIFVSTAASMSGRANTKQAFSEDDPPAATNEYGRSKVRAEEILKEQSKKVGFRLTIIKLPTVYGANPRKDGLFDKLAKEVRGGSLLSRLNWPGKTGLVYVDDVASVIWQLSKKPPTPGTYQIFLVQSESKTIAEISKLMYAKLGRQYKVIRLPKVIWITLDFLLRYSCWLEGFLPANLYNWVWRARLIVDDVIVCDATKIKKTINWRPVLLSSVIGKLI